MRPGGSRPAEGAAAARPSRARFGRRSGPARKPARLRAALAARERDVTERVGAGVAIARRHPAPTDADRIHDEYERAAHAALALSAAGCVAARSAGRRSRVANPDGCAQRRDRRRGVVLVRGMHECERRAGRDSLPMPRISAKPTSGSIASPARRRPPPSATTAMPICRVSIAAMKPARSAVQARTTGARPDSARARSMKSAGPPSAATMRANALRRAAVARDAPRPCRGRPPTRPRARRAPAFRRQAPAPPRAGARRAARRSGNRPRRRPRPRCRPRGRAAVHVGDQRDRRQAGAVGDRDDARGERARHRRASA